MSAAAPLLGRRAAPRLDRVAVRGGDLAVGVWEPVDGGGAESPTVVAVHGITANHRCWALVAEHLPDVRIVAPDLRGRGASNALPGPYGLATHAEDLRAVLDAYGLVTAPVVAHSMGAFVAVLLAEGSSGRVSSLTLVDGGLPLRLPDGVRGDEVDASVLGPAAERLSMTFDSVEAYRDFWHQHPAFGPYWNDAIEGYVDYDLRGESGQLRPASSLAAVGVDVTELYGGRAFEDALTSIRVPTVFLQAPRGLLDEASALYSLDRPFQEPTIEGLDVRVIPEVNHYTIVLGEAGAATVAATARRLMASASSSTTASAPSAAPIAAEGVST